MVEAVCLNSDGFRFRCLIGSVLIWNLFEATCPSISCCVIHGLKQIWASTIIQSPDCVQHIHESFSGRWTRVRINSLKILVKRLQVIQELLCKLDRIAQHSKANLQFLVKFLISSSIANSVYLLNQYCSSTTQYIQSIWVKCCGPSAGCTCTALGWTWFSSQIAWVGLEAMNSTS